MTSFTKRSGTSFTLRPAGVAGGGQENSPRQRARDGLENEGRGRAAHEICGGGESAGKEFDRTVCRVRDLAAYRLRLLKRYQEGGIAGMQEVSRRPHHSPERTPAEVEQRVVELRRQRPDWGARKIRHLLGKEGIALPASTIHRIFLRQQLVRDWDRQPMALRRFERAQPNQLWQMDFKGPKGWDQAVGPLSVLDDHSRYALALENTGSTQARGVQAVLERVFRASGVPEEMLMDHGTPWFNTQGRMGWSQFTVWLMDQDVSLRFSGYQHPQTQGKVERFHRSLTAALLRRGTPEDSERQNWLNDFRQEYNCVRPHEALEMKNARSGVAQEFASIPGVAVLLAISGGQRTQRGRPQRTVPAAPPAPLHHQGAGRERGRVVGSRTPHSGVLPPHPDLRVGHHAAMLDHSHSTRGTCGPSVKDVPERFVKHVMELDT